MGWALFNGAVTLVLFLLWHFILNRKTGANAVNYGLAWPERGLDLVKLLKSALLAIIIFAAAYMLLVLSGELFKTDFRLWVLAFKPMNFLQFRIFLSFLAPYVAFFLILSTALHSQLRVKGNMAVEMLVNVVLLAIGIVVLLAVQYIPFFAGGTLTLAAEPLLTIVAIQFVPLLAIAALVSTYFFRKTGHVYVGAFLNALFITAYIVAGQATHFAM